MASRISAVSGLEMLEGTAGVRVIVLLGEHDVSSAPALRLALAGARQAGCGVVVELSVASFVDSSVLGAILGGLRDAKEDGRGFAVVASDQQEGHVPRLLGITGLRAVFPVFESRLIAAERAAAGHNGPR